MRFLFTLTIFLGSALLFLVEPMVAKLILPRFGGAPAVWTAAMVFFQVALLLGYGYAHLAVKWLGPRRQAVIHIALALLGLLFLPIVLPAGAGVNGGGNPSLVVVGTLATMIGVPFLLLSAGAPLIQRWFAHTDDPLAHDPYFLYSASNLGSMVALIGYPLLVEPALGLREQGRLWTFAYGLLLVLLAGSAVLLWRSKEPAPAEPDAEPTPPLSTKTRLRWIALAAVPSSLLLGATTHITTVIAPIPLLWVLPLTIYLLTFILAFARRRILSARVLTPIAMICAAVLTFGLVMQVFGFTYLQLAIHLFSLFVICWACHQTLAEGRPHAIHLTEFFFFLALGGVVGGVFNSLVAPVLFKSLAEYPVAIVATVLVLPRTQKPSQRWLDIAIPAIVTGLVILLIQLDFNRRWGTDDVTLMQVLGLPVLIALLGSFRTIGYALALTAIFIAVNVSRVTNGGYKQVSDRSFFGVHDVFLYGDEHRLRHGDTMHGTQDMTHPQEPTTYYTRTGPIGLVMAEEKRRRKNMSLAVVGLGAGTMAAYGEKGEKFDFYDIDPTVISMAENTDYFTYLFNCKAEKRVILGDARLSLQAAAPGSYDVILLDAFSSDAIPIHLLTIEAIRLYLSKLAPDGMIAFHISNRYLNLRPILQNVADQLGLVTRFDLDRGPMPRFKNKSLWMVLARDKASLGGLMTDARWTSSDPDPSEPVWTDDYSSVLSLLRKGGW